MFDLLPVTFACLVSFNSHICIVIFFGLHLFLQVYVDVPVVSYNDVFKIT